MEGEKLKEWANENLGSVAELARRLGMTRQTVDQYIGGRLKIGVKFKSKLRAAGVPVDEIFKNKFGITPSENVTEYRIINRVFAGINNELITEENVMGIVSSPYRSVDSSCVFALYVDGDSMTSHGHRQNINDGDIVLVDVSVPVMTNDVAVVKLANGRQVVKQYIDRGEFAVLRSLNSAYDRIHRRVSICYIGTSEMLVTNGCLICRSRREISLRSPIKKARRLRQTTNGQNLERVFFY